MAPKDPVFAERMGHNRARLETLAGRIAMLERQIGTVSDRITPALIERFGERTRAILTGSNADLRRNAIRALVSEVRVTAEALHISGPIAAPEQVRSEERRVRKGVVHTLLSTW